MKRLLLMKEKYPLIGDVRGKGLLIGIDMVAGEGDKSPNKEVRDRIIHEAFNHRLLLLGCGPSTIRIVPPLTITKKHLDEGLDILEKVIAKI